MQVTTRDLCTKLVATFHLSVAERKQLPGGVAPFSEIVAGVGEALESSGWFPRPLAEGPIESGALLELRDGEYWVHEQHEIGVSRSSPTRSHLAPSLDEAVRTYVLLHGGSPLDGVPISWTT